MTEAAAPEQTPEQAALFARVRRMMLIAGLTTALAVGAVLIAIGYRLFRIVSTATAGDRLVVTVDNGGATEILTFDARTLKPSGKLKFANEP